MRKLIISVFALVVLASLFCFYMLSKGKAQLSERMRSDLVVPAVKAVEQSKKWPKEWPTNPLLPTKQAFADFDRNGMEDIITAVWNQEGGTRPHEVWIELQLQSRFSEPRLLFRLKNQVHALRTENLVGDDLPDIVIKTMKAAPGRGGLGVRYVKLFALGNGDGSFSPLFSMETEMKKR